MVIEMVHELQRFLDLISFFRRFLPRFVEIAKLLYSLSKKYATFDLDKYCIAAFKQLKLSLIIFLVLQLYDSRRQTKLHTNASSVALAALLLQKQNSGGSCLL